MDESAAAPVRPLRRHCQHVTVGSVPADFLEAKITVMIDDSDVTWDQHDGGEGHSDQPEWSAEDGPLAARFYSATPASGRLVLDLMSDRPGEQLDADWIVSQLVGRDPGLGGVSGRQLAAASIGGMRRPTEAAGRRLPFYWWRGRNGSPTLYAMKTSVAALFRQARLADAASESTRAAGGSPAPKNANAVEYKAWSFLSLARTARLASGETAYPDELGVRYVFDSTVANHGSVRAGDLAIIRDDRVVLGAGWIDRIQAVPGQKIRNRCPSCGRTDFKYRSEAELPFRCAACATEFDTPEQEQISVVVYTADYARTWRKANVSMPVGELSAAYHSLAAQHSIRRLDPARLRSVLNVHESFGDFWWHQDADRHDPRGGHVIALAKTRLGQQRFRLEMLARFGENCAFTGPQPPQALEAAHLYLYSKTPHHDLRGGLLLRRDLHSLFDAGLMTVNSSDWTICVSPVLDLYEEIRALHGTPLRVPLELRPRARYLIDHAATAAAMAD